MKEQRGTAKFQRLAVEISKGGGDGDPTVGSYIFRLAFYTNL